MITDEEARKLAEEVIAFNHHWLDEYKLAHKVKELLDRQRWIPVAESLPSTAAHCDILIQGGDVPTAAYWNGSDGRQFEHWVLDNSTEKVPREEVTHWRLSEWPIPQPPEQNGDERMSYDKDGKPITYGPHASPPQGASKFQAEIFDKRATTDADKIEELSQRLCCKYAIGPIINGKPEFGWRDMSGPMPPGVMLPTLIDIEAATVLRSLSTKLKDLEEKAEALEWILEEHGDFLTGVLEELNPPDMPAYLKKRLENA